MSGPGTARAPDRVSAALRQPLHLPQLSLQNWELLIRQARRSHLLARIACMVEAQGSFDAIPEAARGHLLAATIVVQAQHAEALRALRHVEHALAHTGVRPVLLFAAAYVAAGLLPAMGRLFSSIHILVPEQRLREVEAALMAGGWRTAPRAWTHQQDEKWQHGLPPLLHAQRQVAVHIHHTVMAGARRSETLTDTLLDRARVLPDLPGFAVLDGTDMVLHCMLNLFHDHRLETGLRDLSDLDLLLRHFGRSHAFWLPLLDRARELDMLWLLHRGLHFTHRMLATPVPLPTLEAAGAGSPGRAASAWADWLWTRALCPQHSTASEWGTSTALFVLRAHALSRRMSAVSLLRHLAVRAFATSS